MLVVLALPALLIILVAGYRIRCSWSPFTTNGRRRILYWGRGWWSGRQAENRDLC